jgi:hypothetical protein
MLLPLRKGQYQNIVQFLVQLVTFPSLDRCAEGISHHCPEQRSPKTISQNRVIHRLSPVFTVRFHRAASLPGESS